MRSPVLLLSLLLAGTAARSEEPQVLSCDWQASAWNIPEPWEENTRTFANGEVRLTLLDTVEPASAAFWLMVLSPPYTEIGDRHCWVVSLGGMGFAGMRFDALEAAYDAGRGLRFTLPAASYDEGTGRTDWAELALVLNQAKGSLTASLR